MKTKGLVLTCLGLVAILISIGIDPYNHPVIKQGYVPLITSGSYGHPPAFGWVVGNVTTYPLLLPAVVSMIVGILLVVVGVGMMLNLYGEKDYHGD